MARRTKRNERRDRAVGNAADALYLRFQRILRRSIEGGRLPAGTVLLEGRLAQLFGSSRAPVRQALAHLLDTGLIERFEGRGYLAGRGGAVDRRVKLTTDMLDIDEPREALRRSFAWESIYEKVERTIIHRSVFGRFRVNELELARHYKVGRTVARDVLTRLQGLGILDKDERQRWIIVSLDRERLGSLYEVRELLEPVALRQAVPELEPDLIAGMRERLVAELEAYPDVSANAMNELEYDLHVRMLDACPNRELIGALLRTRCTLTVSKHVLGVEMAVPERDPFMDEHLQVFDAIVAGKPHGAAEALRRHLLSSFPKVVDRLEAFREIFTPPPVDYIT